jgi:hypothetical protein
MHKLKIVAFAIVLSCSSTLFAADAYDMGKIQVVGQDAQQEKITPDINDLEIDMGERTSPMPDLIPEEIQMEKRPLVEKKIASNIHKENKEEISVALGIGNRGADEIILNGKGVRNGYTGDIAISRMTKDGYKSFYDEEKSGVSGRVTSTGEGSYMLSVNGEYGSNSFAQRGTRLVPTPNAGIEDSGGRIGVTGHSTLEDGSFFKANANITSLGREVKNSSISFSEEDSLFSFSAGASYLKSFSPTFKGRAAISMVSDKYTTTNAQDRELTKSVVDLSGDYDLSGKTNAKFGIKSMSLMSSDKMSPYVKLDHRFAQPWQLVLSYDEDLGNDSMEKIFMPSRYVVNSALKASHLKKMAASLNYRTKKGDTLGIDIFSEKESNYLETLDLYDPGKAMLTSTFRFLNEAKRKGTSLRGSFKIEDHFKISLKSTYQSPEDTSTGRKLSYEPKRTLDVGFNYTEGKVMVDFTRRAEFDRTAYTPTNSFGADDYSRSDLLVRYKLNKTYNAYLKVKDLYDEAKDLRYNVPEEGRLTVAGVEAHF